MTEDLSQFIRDIPDFPKPGILFRDITPLLASPHAFEASVEQLATRFEDANITAVVAAEARGFIFAAPLALRLEASFIPVRKPGKLPFNTQSFEYDLEYGSDTLEMHTDALDGAHNVLLIDDLLATGGTMRACIELVSQSGANIAGCAFVIELAFLNGRDALAPHNVHTLLTYD